MSAQEPQIPQSVPFFYSIKLIKPDFSQQDPRYSNSDWLPPNIKEAFEVLHNGVWFLWTPGNASSAPQILQQTIQTYSVTSIFWCHDRQAFQQVPYDCTQKDVGKTTHDGMPLKWEPLSFQHNRTEDNNCIALIGYRYEQDKLDARGSPRWVPKLLPERYQHPGTPEHLGTCHLAGQLSILVGLVAFSTTANKIHEVIKNAFRKDPDWSPHNQEGTGRMSLTIPSLIRTDKAKDKTSVGLWCELGFNRTAEWRNVSKPGKRAAMVPSYYD